MRFILKFDEKRRFHVEILNKTLKRTANSRVTTSIMISL
jgi:hypothetical protein